MLQLWFGRGKLGSETYLPGWRCPSASASDDATSGSWTRAGSERSSGARLENASLAGQMPARQHTSALAAAERRPSCLHARSSKSGGSTTAAGRRLNSDAACETKVHGFESERLRGEGGGGVFKD